MNILQANESDREQWNAYVNAHPHANIYHMYNWGRFFKEFYNLTPINLVVKSGNTIVGLVPVIIMKNYAMKNIMVSLPYFCIGGVLADSPKIAELLLSEIKRLTALNKCDHTLLRSEQLHNNFDFDHVGSNKSTFVLALNEDHESVFNGFQKQIRRRIRKGYKSGCEIDISKKYIDDFYNIYRINMRLLGSPAHRRSFYSEIIKRFPDNYNVLVIRLEGKIIGAQLLSYFKKTVYLPLASSLREFNSYSPNHLLYWESIKYGCENGYDFCDFGRSTVDSGPHIFKKQWNATEYPLHYYYLYSQNHTANVGDTPGKKLELISRMWKKTPASITNLMGPLLSKWLP